jgi:hypothetical protein
MNDNRPVYIKLYEAAQSALERGDKQTHDDLSFAAYQAKMQEAIGNAEKVAPLRDSIFSFPTVLF